MGHRACVLPRPTAPLQLFTPRFICLPLANEARITHSTSCSPDLPCDHTHRLLGLLLECWPIRTHPLPSGKVLPRLAYCTAVPASPPSFPQPQPVLTLPPCPCSCCYKFSISLARTMSRLVICGLARLSTAFFAASCRGFSGP